MRGQFAKNMIKTFKINGKKVRVIRSRRLDKKTQYDIFYNREDYNKLTEREKNKLDNDLMMGWKI